MAMFSKSKGGLLARSQPDALRLGHVHASAPESGEGQAPSLPHPSYVSLCPARISTPPLIVTVPTAANMTVILTSQGQARPIPHCLGK